MSDGFTIESDVLRVSVNTHHPETGEKLEPEEKPAQRILGTHAPVEHGQGPMAVGVGSMPTQVIVEAPAIELAKGAREMCMGCKNFDNRAWFELFRAKSSTISGREELEQLCEFLGFTNNGEIFMDGEGEVDLAETLKNCGICHPLTEVLGEPLIVSPISSCPKTLADGRPFESCFEPASNEAEKRGTAVFDAVMRQAQGK